MDTGEEQIEDDGLRQRLRRQAAGIMLKATLAAALATAIIMLL